MTPRMARAVTPTSEVLISLSSLYLTVRGLPGPLHTYTLHHELDGLFTFVPR